MKYYKKSYDELVLLLVSRDAEIVALRDELERERAFSLQAVETSMRQADASDKMKLDLILSGAFSVPKTP